MRNKSKIYALIGFFLVLPLIPLSPTANAITISELQSQISALTKYVAALQEQLKNPSPLIETFSFQFNLYRGRTDAQTNGEVSKLQKFLAQALSIYPERKITGYFGPLTERAVQRYQEKNNIAFSTIQGYGVVGPKTRAVMRKEAIIAAITPEPLLRESFLSLLNPSSPPSPPVTATSTAATSTSTVSTNSPPRVNIINPYGVTLTAPASVEIIASASDDDGTISKVEFFEGRNLLGTVSQPPWSVRWQNINVGDYSLTAKATDDKGAQTTSSPVNISVTQLAGSGRTNSPPVISLSGIPSTSSTVAVTASGNEITDASRTTNTQGDGRTPPDSSYGIWESTTNIMTNGGFETNTTGWAAYGNVTSLTRVTTEQKFGTASLEVILPGTYDYSGAAFSLAGFTVGQTYTFSVWLKGSGTVKLYKDLAPQASSALITLTSTWTRYSLTFVATDTTDKVEVITVTSQAITFYLDGVQVELQPLATPYVETDGGTAARSAARVQAPASLIDETQAWIAMRMRMGWANTAELYGGSDISFFEYADDGNNYIRFTYVIALDVFNLRRSAAGTGVNNLTAAQTFSAGDTKTLIAAWTATQTKISVDGGVFAAVANSNVPTLAVTLVDIARRTVADRHADSDILWFACGTGTLTDANAATINGFGSTDPSPLDFPYDSNLTLLWKGDNASSSAAVATATATASDYDGAISQVVFTDTATNVVTDTTSPFSAQIPLSVGTHTISAIATDNEGATTRSASSTIVVD